LLTSELPRPDSDPLRVRYLGEDLVAFRDSDGRVGLIQNHCPHRGASLFFGRSEEAGVRCVYHGWKFDVDGNCVDMPNEPAESDFKHKVRAVAYPAVERSGVIWTYMGPRDKQPPLPELEWSCVPESHVLVTKRRQDSNYLQAIEGGIDSSHVSFLHSTLRSSEGVPRIIRGRARYLAADRHPHFEVLQTDYGLLIGARRNAEANSHYWRITQFLAPWFQMIPAEPGEPINGHAWIPIDDEHCWTWSITWDPEHPLSQELLAELRTGTDIHSNVDDRFRPLANRENDYRIDRAAQRSTSYTGIVGISEQDTAVQESMGPIYDRSGEHLGTTDLAIIQMRRLLLNLSEALEVGHEPLPAAAPQAYRVHSTTLLLPRNADWTTAAREASLRR
jgi:nitrite reductase/ring-hydroxylating ferredoxin subunit